MRCRSIGSTLLVLVLAVLTVTSCAVAQRAMLRSKGTYDEVLKASIDSLFDVRFSASSADAKTGFIVAEQAVVWGEGTVSRLNITVIRMANGTEVTVSFVPPPWAIGGEGIVDRYAAALKKRIPDVEITR